ncbi:hypothetical protein I4F81_003074 [Pyropia yezoensis]|uniref:Uncharacterized protein n=1 Tax=Pyropia yezoensis TaxID=2788 RepID=A0ACC3BRB2_PYRYE|nr:hypothetical protein I4F81_003074 [Neopyropia yezoensis]
MRSRYAGELGRDGRGGLTGDLDASSMTLMRLWTLPADVAFQSVAAVALGVAEDSAIRACVQRYAEEDPRYAPAM